jgi:hypothetical protein
MKTLDELLALRGADLREVTERTGADPAQRRPSKGYQNLSDGVESFDTPDGSRVFVRGDELLMIHVDEEALPPGVDADTLAEAVGTAGEALRSRQGRRAMMHVVADQGIAWSEEDGELGFVEIFPPSDFEAYRSRIYQQPGAFIR